MCAETRLDAFDGNVELANIYPHSAMEGHMEEILYPWVYQKDNSPIQLFPS